MAKLLWGKVYFQDNFAGYIHEEPGNRITFSYDESYINAAHPAVSHTLAVRPEPYVSDNGLHPFFDNLVSEGWLEQAQTRLLGKRKSSRFALLLAFGFDCIGAISIIDPESAEISHAMLDNSDAKAIAVMGSRASLSGVQPKMAIVEDAGIFRAAQRGEISTHIAKFSSPGHSDLVENEYLTTLAFKAILSDDDTVELAIETIKGVDEPALLIKRFDRNGKQRIHFEEFNQLLGKPAEEKYDGAYRDMAAFMRETDSCLSSQIYLLYRRILTGLLLGNTDMHLKNFALLHTKNGLRLTPSYDQVAAALYQYKTIALTLAGSRDHLIGKLKARQLVLLGEESGLSRAAIHMAVEEIKENLTSAKDAIAQAKLGSTALKDNLIKFVEKRWNGTFALIGKALSKKR